MYQVYTGIYAVYAVISDYILDLYSIYPSFASHGVNSDLSNSDSRISCNVHEMCIHDSADSSIINFPKCMKKSIQNIAGI